VTHQRHGRDDAEPDQALAHGHSQVLPQDKDFDARLPAQRNESVPVPGKELDDEALLLEQRNRVSRPSVTAIPLVL
jgi:hypothetical protein